ncbi:peptidase M42, partial [Aliarcobacter butzleri]
QPYQLTARSYTNRQALAYGPRSGGSPGIGQIKDASMCEEINNLIFEIEGLSHLQPGTPIAFSGKLKSKDDLISAQLDNV